MGVKRRRKAVWVAILAAAAVFAASALAAGANVSGYERLKAAGFKLIDRMDLVSRGGVEENAKYRTSLSVVMDGAELTRSDYITMSDGARSLTWEMTRDMFRPASSGLRGDDTKVTYKDSDVLLTWYPNYGFYETKRYSLLNPGQPTSLVNGLGGGGDGGNDNGLGGGDDGGNDNGLGGGDDGNGLGGNDVVGDAHLGVPPLSDDDGSTITPAQRRLIETVADALIGDTRNYFVTDGGRVSITLSGNQIPELAQVALAAVVERITDGLYHSTGLAIGFDAKFSYGSLAVDLDGAGNMVGASLAIAVKSTVNGVARECWLYVEHAVSDIGTTRVDKPEASEQSKPALPALQ